MRGVSGDDPVGGAGSGVPRCGANRNAGRSGPRPPGRYGLARAVAAAPVPHCREPASWVRIRKPPRWSAERGPGRPGTGGRASQARPKERVRPVGAPSPLIGGTELLLSRRPPAPKPPWARRRRRKQMRRRRRTRAQQRAAGTKKTALFDIVNAVMGNGSLRAPRLRARGARPSSRVPGERSETRDQGRHGTLSRHDAARVLRWVPGLVPLAQARSLHSPGTRDRRTRPRSRLMLRDARSSA